MWTRLTTSRQMNRIHSFPPLSRSDARTLILGSMPGKVSLRDVQYYAHPRNAFWPIMATLFDAPEELAYEERVAQLLGNRVALWDVLQSCTRGSSLDSDIDEASIVPNDFVAFFARHREIECVLFNGTKAETAYMRYVKPVLPVELGGLRYCRVPSTSPANASISPARKLDAWRKVISRSGTVSCR